MDCGADIPTKIIRPLPLYYHGWLIEDPELARILDPAPELASDQITHAEERIVILILHHLASAHEAMELGLYPSWSGRSQSSPTVALLVTPGRFAHGPYN